MNKVMASIHVDGEEEVSADYISAHELRMRSGDPVQVRSTVHVWIGRHACLWGEPHVLLRVLCDALARAREAEAAGSQEVVTDLGGMA